MSLTSLACKAFTTIGYAIPKAKSKEDIQTLFQVTKLLSDAVTILACLLDLKEYLSSHDPKTWQSRTHWCNWWTRPNHISVSLNVS